MRMRFGVDLGGTKIELAALDAQGAMVYRQRIATPKGDYHQTVQAISELVIQAKTTLGCEASIGIGIPGSISKQTGLVKNANSTWLIGQDLEGDLGQALGQAVVVANDANCFALSEAVDGSGKHSDVVFGVIIGTGCGGGLVVHQKIVNGVNSIAGEWGHNPLPWCEQDFQQNCYCGHSGCIETYLSGTGLEQHYDKCFGAPLSAEQIVKASLVDGDVNAQGLLDQYVEWLAKGLASVINIVDPDVIVLGGGLSNIEYLYEAVPKIWSRWIFTNDEVQTQLMPPKFGDSSGVRGAAWLPEFHSHQ
jgi:fructokinase